MLRLEAGVGTAVDLMADLERARAITRRRVFRPPAQRLGFGDRWPPLSVYLGRDQEERILPMKASPVPTIIVR
jgi:hypothetical protein